MAKKYRLVKFRVYAKLLEYNRNLKFVSISELAKSSKCSRGYVQFLIKELNQLDRMSFITRNNVKTYQINRYLRDYLKNYLKGQELWL